MASNIATHDSNDAAATATYASNHPSIPNKTMTSSFSNQRKMITNTPSSSSLQIRQNRQQPKPTVLSDQYDFNFELPGYVQVMDDEVSKLVSLGHKHWLPFAQRLTGWRKQVRTRYCGLRDHVYFHGSKRFRTFKDVKRYIYLGYPPSKENADEPLERWALEQPDPQQKKVPSS